MTPAKDALLNRQFGPYLIEEKLGAGGMAAVYRAVHQKKGRTVALKVLHPIWTNDPDISVRFQKEAEIVRALQHPCIVAVYDYGVFDERPYLAMQYMSRGSLASRFAEPSPIGSQEVVRLLRRVASGLDHAHRLGVVHRDLKVENILLDERGEAYLSDFGIARVIGGQRLTATGNVIGTPLYMSPEQVRAKKDLDFRSDLYSLAVVLYVLTVGRFPFLGGEPLAILHQHVSATPPLPSHLDSKLPKALDAVILKGLAKRPEERYPSADAFVEAYARALADQPPRSIVVDLRSERPVVTPHLSIGPSDDAQPAEKVDDLVEAAWKATNRDEAIAYLKRALALDPWHNQANRMLFKLEGARPQAAEPRSDEIARPLPPLERKVRAASWERRSARRRMTRRLGCLGGLLAAAAAAVFVLTAVGLLPGFVTAVTTLTGGPAPVLEINGVPIQDVPNAVLSVPPSQSRSIQSRDLNLLENGYLHEYTFEAASGDEVTVYVEFFSLRANRVSRNVAILDPSGHNYVSRCQQDAAVQDAPNKASYRCPISATGLWSVRVLGRSDESTGAYVIEVGRLRL